MGLLGLLSPAQAIAMLGTDVIILFGISDIIPNVKIPEIPLGLFYLPQFFLQAGYQLARILNKVPIYCLQ
jgi:hypothetical protein